MSRMKKHSAESVEMINEILKMEKRTKFGTIEAGNTMMRVLPF
jgi:hypothetical protein